MLPEIYNIDSSIIRTDSNMQEVQRQAIISMTNVDDFNLSFSVQWQQDIHYLQTQVNAVDDAIGNEYEETKDESVVLSLEEILQTLQESETANSVEIEGEYLQEEYPTKKRRKPCNAVKCHKRAKLSKENRVEDIFILSPLEEQQLMGQMEREAWKVGRSVITYLDSVTEGICDSLRLKKKRRRRRRSRHWK